MSPDVAASAAREACLRQYADAHESFSVREQIAVCESRMAEAAGERQFAQWAIRAYAVELDDPKPKAPVLAACGACPARKCDGCRMCREMSG